MRFRSQGIVFLWFRLVHSLCVWVSCSLLTPSRRRTKKKLFLSNSWLQFAEVRTIPSHVILREILLIAAIQYSIVARPLFTPPQIRIVCSALNSNVKMVWLAHQMPFSFVFLALFEGERFAFILPLWPSVYSMAIWLVSGRAIRVHYYYSQFQFLGSIAFSCKRILTNHFYEICTTISDDRATQTTWQNEREKGHRLMFAVAICMHFLSIW